MRGSWSFFLALLAVFLALLGHPGMTPRIRRKDIGLWVLGVILFGCYLATLVLGLLLPCWNR